MKTMIFKNITRSLLVATALTSLPLPVCGQQPRRGDLEVGHEGNPTLKPYKPIEYVEYDPIENKSPPPPRRSDISDSQTRKEATPSVVSWWEEHKIPLIGAAAAVVVGALTTCWWWARHRRANVAVGAVLAAGAAHGGQHVGIVPVVPNVEEGGAAERNKKKPPASPLGGEDVKGTRKISSMVSTLETHKRFAEEQRTTTESEPIYGGQSPLSQRTNKKDNKRPKGEASSSSQSPNK